MEQQVNRLLQSLPQFRGKRRASRLLLKMLGLENNTNVTVETKSGFFALPNLREIVSFDLFVNGEYEGGLVRLLKNEIPPAGIFIDVGANIGSISIPLAIARPDIQIVAIEASTWIFDFLSTNIKLNNIQNIRAFNRAVYFESGKKMTIYTHKEWFGKGSLKPTFSSDGETIETVALDDLRVELGLPRVDFLKVDVEGFEICVFKGLNQIIEHSSPKIVFEFDEWTEKKAGFEAGAAKSFLQSKGYNLQSLDGEFRPISNGDNEASLNSSNLLAVKSN